MEPEDTDFLCSQTSPKDGKAFVDKGFTKDVNPNAIYPLKLDVTATWNQQVRRQEHFIAYGEWSRDTQYLMDKGQMGGGLPLCADYFTSCLCQGLTAEALRRNPR